MLELRLNADAKRIASMCDAVLRECARLKTGEDHADVVSLVVAQLVTGDDHKPVRGRASDVLVIVTVQSDATMVMVRDARPAQLELGESRDAVLKRYTTRWSTMSGRDGRTIWAEVCRSVQLHESDRETTVNRRGRTGSAERTA